MEERDGGEMKYLLFHRTGTKNNVEFIRGFRTFPALKKFVADEIADLMRTYPGIRFSKNDYMIARVVKGNI
jgi:hypothetical protein